MASDDRSGMAYIPSIYRYEKGEIPNKVDEATFMTAIQKFNSPNEEFVGGLPLQNLPSFSKGLKFAEWFEKNPIK